MLQITSLQAGIHDTEIIKDLSLEVKAGRVTTLMGPNGSGKSTLANILAGHPSYIVTSGSITFKERDLLSLSPEERASAGIFLAFQYPISLPGVSISHFLRLALNAQEKARSEEITDVAGFIRLLREKMKILDIPMSFAERSVNDGFSGGEKKRLEMLQMLVLQPRLVILDEVDSGLDIDAIKIVAQAVQHLDSKKTAVLVITHYQRILNYLTPDHVHVMKNGHIVQSGGKELAHQLEKTGYADL